jgi:hypothetical protein
LPFVKSVVGVDISQGMVDAFNARVSAEGLSSTDIHAVNLQLTGEGGELGGQTFDVVVVSALSSATACVLKSYLVFSGLSSLRIA